MTIWFSSIIPIAKAVTISMGIPGTNPNSTSSSPGAFIANFYQFALMIGGILAFGVIVYGGVRYMISSGNPSGQSDAKEWIEAALLGLLLLAGAYFILNVINPQLVNLNLPSPSSLPQANIPISSSPANTPQQAAACGSKDANGNSQVGQCTNSSNGSVNYCCYSSFQNSYSCYSTPC